MAWKTYPVVTKDPQDKEIIQNQLINLDNIGYFRKWADSGTDRSVGYSVSGKKHLIDIPFKQLEDELTPNNTTTKV